MLYHKVVADYQHINYLARIRKASIFTQIKIQISRYFNNLIIIRVILVSIGAYLF